MATEIDRYEYGAEREANRGRWAETVHSSGREREGRYVNERYMESGRRERVKQR